MRMANLFQQRQHLLWLILLTGVAFVWPLRAQSTARDESATPAPAKVESKQQNRGHLPPADTLSLTQRYFSRLTTAGDSTFAHEFESDFLLILDKRQKTAYLSLPNLETRKLFIQQYWRANDPDPLLPENDCLLCHLQRVAYARAHFPARHPPYVDDRGKYYIIYGRPSVRYADPGGIRRIDLFTPDVYQRITTRYYNLKNGPQRTYSVPPNESWAYENVSPDFVVHFVGNGPEFREVSSLADILPTQRNAHLAWQWSDLIKNRASVSPALSRAAAEIRLFESELLMASSSDIATGNRITKGTAHMKMIKTIERGEARMIEARRHVPPTAYQPVHAENKLTFLFDSAQFRAPSGKTRVELDILLPLQNNFVPHLDTAYADTLHLELSAMLRNRFYQTLVRQDRPVVAYTVQAARYHRSYFFERFIFELSPQYGEVTLQVRDLDNGRLGFTKQIYPVEDFSGDRLMLSDLQLYSEIPDEVPDWLFPSREISGKRVTPVAAPAISRSRPVLCYFEIYNLKASGIGDAYEIAYRVITEGKGAGLLNRLRRLLGDRPETSIGMAIEQPVIADVAQELIALDLQSLANGRHIIEITVSDPNYADRSTTVKRVVELVD